MVRIVVAVLLLAFGGTASAGKPKIAILGLEVRGPGKPDPKAVAFAKELTEQLRMSPKAGRGPYALAPGSDKALTDLKLLANCDDEATACMVSIGKDLAADWLLFGRIEAKGTGYQVSLKLLDVAGKRLAQSSTDLYDRGDSSVELAAFAKRMYSKVTGVASEGTLVVKANVERGTVLIDGEERGTLAGGRLQIALVSEGKHKLAVESAGYKRWEADVVITSGETTATTVQLVKR